MKRWNVSTSRLRAALWFKMLVILGLRLDTAWGRTWNDVEIFHSLSPPLSNQYLLEITALITEVNPLKEHQQQEQTEAPVIPSVSPSAFASNMLSQAPTARYPSGQPTATSSATSETSSSPTITKSEEPSLAATSQQPSEGSSQGTTEESDPYPFNEPPEFPDPWYFNYDTRPGALYGPGYATLVAGDSGVSTKFENNQWADTTNGVDIVADPDFYWKEFGSDAEGGFGTWKGVLANHIPSRNQCGRVGLQSPINVRHNGLSLCGETREIRSLRGDYTLSSSSVKKEIHGNKLRLRYERRPCANLTLTECQEPDPPMADFPNGWGGYSDALHADFKVPSEHLLNGVRYDAELQVYHLHDVRRRIPSTATLIQATDDGFNAYFDNALQAFQLEFDRDALLCASKQRRERKLVQDFYGKVMMGDQPQNDSKVDNIDYQTWARYSIESDAPKYQEEWKGKNRRQLQSSSAFGIWDPHHPMLEPSVHFYRYEGSITEPPCGEFVSWYVTDVPMTISTDQLKQLKNILFNHVDYNCRRTSVHYEQSVARPIQETMNRPVTLCTSLDFGPDPN